MSKVLRFEELRIWQEARILVKSIYNELEMSARAERDWGFKNQIQSASVSIMNNIAEGFERGSDKDFARFLDIAKASCGEVRSMLYIAKDLDYLNEEMFTHRSKNPELISRGIATLSKHLRK